MPSIPKRSRSYRTRYAKIYYSEQTGKYTARVRKYGSWHWISDTTYAKVAETLAGMGIKSR